MAAPNPIDNTSLKPSINFTSSYWADPANSIFTEKTTVKITNNNVNLSGLASYSSYAANGISISGKLTNNAIISNNNVVSASSSYSNGINIGDQINVNIIGNNIFGFDQNGIYLSGLNARDIGIISENKISRTDNQNITSFISGQFASGSARQTSALIVDNYFSHDTVDGADNWQDAVKNRGTKWTVERNKNQIDEVLIDPSVGSKYYENDTIEIVDGTNTFNFTFKNKVVLDSTNKKVNFIIDNSIKHDDYSVLQLLRADNKLYRTPAWHPEGPFSLKTELVFGKNYPQKDQFFNALFFPTPDPAIDPSVFGYSRYINDITWFPAVGVSDITFDHPFYSIKNGRAVIDPSTPALTGKGIISELKSDCVLRIYDQIKKNFSPPPKRCRVIGSTSGNDGIYEIDTENFVDNLNAGFISIKKIIGITYNEDSLNNESKDLSSKHNYFYWSINSKDFLPDNVFVIKTSCNIDVTQHFANDNSNYNLNVGSRKIFLQVGNTAHVDEYNLPAPEITSGSETLTVDTSSGAVRSPIIFVRADLPAVADYRKVEVSNLTVRYKW